MARKTTNRKLSNDDVITIRSEYIAYSTTLKELAEKYNVSQYTIHNIIKRKTYKEVGREND